MADFTYDDLVNVQGLPDERLEELRTILNSQNRVRVSLDPLPKWYKVEILCHEGWRNASLLSNVERLYGLEVEAYDELARWEGSCPGCCFRVVACEISEATVH